VTAADADDAVELVRNWIGQSEQFRDLEYSVQIDYIGEIEDVREEIYADEDVVSSLLDDPLNPGLWYRTGVGWY